MFIVLAILVFGFLIAIHEAGHFFAAKKLGVRVIEFSIGMGPRLLKKQRGETLYSLKLLPFGGSCLMAGEDEEIENNETEVVTENGEVMQVLDPRAFTSQPRLRRAVILAAGAFMNLLVGVIIITTLVFTRSTPFYGNELEKVKLEESAVSIFEPGDKIISINGSRVYYFDDIYSLISMAKMRGNDAKIDFVVLRDGKKITLRDQTINVKMFYSNGADFFDYVIVSKTIDLTFGSKLKYSMYDSYNNMRSVWLGLRMLITGGASLKDMSGPVGIVDIMNQAGSSTHQNDQGETVKDPISKRLRNVFNIAALIAINLAVVNLLPIPALDGGRIFGLVITWLIEKITRRHVSPKYEGYVHAAGLVLLLGLTVIVLVSDILKVVK